MTDQGEGSPLHPSFLEWQHGVLVVLVTWQCGTMLMVGTLAALGPHSLWVPWEHWDHAHGGYPGSNGSTLMNHAYGGYPGSIGITLMYNVTATSAPLASLALSPPIVWASKHVQLILCPPFKCAL